VALAVATTSWASAETTYKNIGLDCGGWFVGFAAHKDGRLYGYGDVYGMWRSDDKGLSWKPLQLGFSTSDNFVMGAAVKADDANTVGFITEGRSLYKSTNGGASWSVAIPLEFDSSRYYGSTQLINHPTSGRHNEWLIARKRPGMTGQLWRSANGLSSTASDWTKLGGSTFDGDNKPTTVYIHKNFPDQIWVGTTDVSSATTGGVGGLYVSVDNGANFTKVWPVAGTVETGPGWGRKPSVGAIARRDDGIGFVAANVDGVLVTAGNWSSPSTYAFSKVIGRINDNSVTSVAVLPSGEFVTGQDPYGLPSKIWKSDTTPNHGETWTNLNPRLAIDTPVPSYTLAPTNSTTPLPSYRSMITIDPLDPTRWYTTGGFSPSISTDSGLTWKFPPNGNGLAAVNCYSATFPLGNANKVLIAGADLGVFTFNDGGASGKPDFCARMRVRNPSGTLEEHHQTYHEVMSSTNGETLVAAGVEQAASKNMIIRSTNGGQDWDMLNLDPTTTGLPANGEGVVRATARPDKINDFVVVLGSDKHPSTPGVWRTQDGGKTFEKTLDLTGVKTGGRYDFLGKTWISRAPDRPDTVYLSTGGATAILKGFRKSVDGGTNWTLGPQPWNGNHSMSGMSVDPAVPGRVWAAYDSTWNGSGNLLFRSDDYGDSWTPENTFAYFKDANVARVSAANRYVAVWAKRPGDDGFKLYASKDDGANWNVYTFGNMGTPDSIRYGHALNINVDPYRKGKIWITGMTSVHVVDIAAEAD
jgi:hypothetical protein